MRRRRNSKHGFPPCTAPRPVGQFVLLSARCLWSGVCAHNPWTGREDLHMKRAKNNILLIKEKFWLRPLGESASLLLEVEQPRSALELTVPFKNAVTGVIAPPGGQRCLQSCPGPTTLVHLMLSGDSISCRSGVWKFLLLLQQQFLYFITDLSIFISRKNFLSKKVRHDQMTLKWQCNIVHYMRYNY